MPREQHRLNHGRAPGTVAAFLASPRRADGGPRGGATGPSGGTCAAAGSRQQRGHRRGAEATRPGAASGGRAPEAAPVRGQPASLQPQVHQGRDGAHHTEGAPVQRVGPHEQGADMAALGGLRVPTDCRSDPGDGLAFPPGSGTGRRHVPGRSRPGGLFPRSNLVAGTSPRRLVVQYCARKSDVTNFSTLRCVGQHHARMHVVYAWPLRACIIVEKHGFFTHGALIQRR